MSLLNVNDYLKKAQDSLAAVVKDTGALKTDQLLAVAAVAQVHATCALAAAIRDS